MSEVVEKGISRLAYQFKNSVKLQEFLEAFLAEFEELRISGLQLLNERYLNDAVGVQLDGIGEIVGLPRPEKDVDIAGLFGFLDDPTALGFGDITDSDIGGNFWDGVSDFVLVGDNLYRLLIRAKIIENKTAMTVDDTLRLISFTFDGAVIRYFQSAFLEPRYDILKDLTIFEEGLLADLPVLIGIDSVEYHTYTDGTFSFFGDPDPTGLGFGDINSHGYSLAYGSGYASISLPSIGGNFAKIVGI